VVVYCAKEKAVKRFAKNQNVQVDGELVSRLQALYGESRVRVVEKGIAKQ
jgi:DNA polymerase-3 subunit alpha